MRACCSVIPRISLSGQSPGSKGANLSLERDRDFKCYGRHVTPPPLDVEIFLADDHRLEEVKNLTKNEEVIHLSNLTPNQEYSLMLRARPSLDLSRTISSPWLNFTIHTLPDGLYIYIIYYSI